MLDSYERSVSFELNRSMVFETVKRSMTRLDRCS